MQIFMYLFLQKSNYFDERALFGDEICFQLF